jgi:hypothetical protein
MIDPEASNRFHHIETGANAAFGVVRDRSIPDRDYRIADELSTSPP